MIYLSLDTNKIKLLFFKKSLLGQYEIGFFNKKHEVEFLQNAQITNVDLLASAIKEGLTQANSTPIKEKDVCLILPPNAFQFLRITIPKDITQTAIDSFIKDKVRATLPKETDNYLYGYITKENNNQHEVLFYAIDKDIFKKYQDTLNLLDLKLTSLLPINLAYFKLFEKTLRNEKREKILYIHYDKSILGYLLDSLGPLPQKGWSIKSVKTEEFENVLKQKVQEFEKEGIKLNRIILSGTESDKIRQDTFTKSVGVWTNLLKRIIPNFYQDYLKMIIAQKNDPLPFLELDECFGAFIFYQEEKGISLFKNDSTNNKRHSLPKLKLPLKEIGIFVISFALSFLAFYIFSQNKSKFNFQASIGNTKPSATKAPSPQPPTPTPTIAKEKLKIKVLNGSGTPGKAAAVVEIMKNKGYQETINGGNADEFNYEVTEIKTKKNSITQANIIKDDLKNYVASFKNGEELDEKENADVIIIIGKDFK